MDYRPRDFNMWDPTIIRVGDTCHLFHLQSRRGAPRDHPDNGSIGHATSGDMYLWEEQPIALRRGADPTDWDSSECWHLDVTEWQGTYYMFYTGRSLAESGRVQRIGLATSRDLFHWEKHAAGPILEADARWYETAMDPPPAQHPDWKGWVTWRDPYVVADSTGGVHWMFLVARTRQGDPSKRGCVAVAKSADLVHWEVQPPAFAPGRHHSIGVPQVFEHGARYYLLYHSSGYFDQPIETTDPHCDAGIFYATSPMLTQGYTTPDDEILIGGGRGMSGRTIRLGDQRYLYYWVNCYPAGTDQAPDRQIVLSTPKLIRFDDQGAMAAAYDPQFGLYADRALVETAPAPSAEGWKGHNGTIAVVPGAVPVVTFSVVPDAVDYEAEVTFGQGGRAGLVIRADASGNGGVASVVNMDECTIDLLILGEPAPIERRHCPTAPGTPIHLRAISRAEHIEVYVDDRLMFQQVRYQPATGRLGLFAQDAEATFAKMRAIHPGVG